MRKDIPQSGTIVWKDGAEPMSLHQMFEHQDMVIVQQLTEELLAAYDLQNRLVYVQETNDYRTEQHNLLWVKEHKLVLFQNWWFLRNQHDQIIKGMQSKEDAPPSPLILPNHMNRN